MRAVLGLSLAAVAATVLLACGEAEDVVQTDSPSATTPAASGTQTPTPDSGVTVTSEPSPPPTSSPGPTAGWRVYEPASSLFSVQYPSDWFAADGSISSRDLAAWDGPGRVADAIEVEFGSYVDDGVSGCGIISVDKSGGQVIPNEATAIALDDEPAWRLVRDEGDPLLEGVLTRIDAISSIHAGYCFTIVGYFTQDEPDTAAFDAIVATFEFAS